MSETLVIRGNGHWRPFLDRYEIPAAVTAPGGDLDWVDADDSGFIRYKGCYEHIGNFLRCPPGSWLAAAGWHGYHAHGFSVGWVIRVSPDGETYQIARYY
jgi:hypothetical protein